MASSLPTTMQSTASSSSKTHYKYYKACRSALFLPFSPKFNLPSLSKDLKRNRDYSFVTKANLNEDTKEAGPSNGTQSQGSAAEESVSEFILQVANLVKLVDSRDIVELQLKQYDCEVLIRKKEALPQPALPAQALMMPSPSPQAMMAPSPPAASAVWNPAPPSPLPSTPPPAKSTKSSLPALKCPMSGTFYRSPAPGEPPFVKVGDKVQKGQVLCIIEAMKLMNEIEADQSGTIVEILAEDGKSVSVDTPLFVIEP